MADKYEYKKFEYDVPWDAEGKYTSFTPSASTNAALTNKTNAEKAYTDFVGAGYTYANQQMLNDYMSKYQGRSPFSYDFNTDAMYQQYKDKYMKQGKMAMQDTMGQAAAMTGGYGSSYASTAGNQAYQASLENLNDIIPQLYQMAYDRYNQEGQEMLNNISLLQSERGFDYGVWGDKANMLAGDRSYYGTQYDNEWSRDYGQWSADRTFDRGIWESDRTLAQGEHQASEGVRYDEYRNTITDAQWQKNFEEGQRQFNESMAFSKQQYEDSKKAAQNSNSSTSMSSIEKRLTSGEFTTAADMEDYLTGLVNAGIIDNNTAIELLRLYKPTERKAYNERKWTLEDDGGWNWFGGIDGNAEFKDEYGDIYTGDEIYEALIKAGMSEGDAEQYVKNLQHDLGATDW